MLCPNGTAGGHKERKSSVWLRTSGQAAILPAGGPRELLPSGALRLPRALRTYIVRVLAAASVFIRTFSVPVLWLSDLLMSQYFEVFRGHKHGRTNAFLRCENLSSTRSGVKLL